jgi:hypothetical protein
MSKTANIPFEQRLGCSVSEAGQVLSRGRQGIYDDLNAGLLRAIKLNKRTVISVPSVLDLARNRGLLDTDGKRLELEEPKTLQGTAKGNRRTKRKRRA